MNSAPILDLDRLTSGAIAKMNQAEFESLLSQGYAAYQTDRKEMAIVHYVPASDNAERVHLSTARVRMVAGGNRSSKTCTGLAECIMVATGIVPDHLRAKHPDFDWKKKLRGPVHGRVVCQSISNVLEPTILPKLHWKHWDGVDEPGGERGHWGLIPKICLIDGEWERSWSPKSRMLRMLYRNPDNVDEVIGESSIQFFSYDQKPEDFASAHCHFVLLDEPPSLPIYRECEARTLSAKGWILLSMTWPDDPSINVDWLYEEVYERALEGPNKHPDYEFFELHSTDNRNLDQEALRQQMSAWDERTKRVRIYGQQVRFSNRVHQDFTDSPRHWCFTCGEDKLVVDGQCTACASTDTTPYCHVEDFAWDTRWPVIQVIDPHPRKPHMCTFEVITPQDDWWQVAELECSGDPSDLRAASEDLASALGMRVVRRLIDPKMAGNPSGTNRDRTWGDEFDAAGLYCDPAISSDVGRSIVDQMLKPDPRTRKPRMLVHPRCVNSIYQMKRFMWEDWKLGTDKGQKQKAKEKYDDYPACKRYLANDEPTYDGLVAMQRGGMIQSQIRHYPTRSAAR